MRKLHRLCTLILAMGVVSTFAFGQDFTGTWTLYANGYKGELYLKQDGNQVRGWMGVNGVNLDSDTLAGTVNGNEILFTRRDPTLPTPQEYRGFILLHDNPQIPAGRRMTGADAMAGIASHNGQWNFGWYATRLGPYREPAGNVPANVSPPTSSLPGLGRVWKENEQGWSGVWTRRGDTNVFDAVWTKPGQPTAYAVLTITLSGNAISIRRTSTTGTPEHTYRGQIASDGVSVSGVYSLGVESSTWSATILASPGLGRVWNESEQGWSGVWTRRGDTNVFDAVWTKPGQPTAYAVLTMTLNGNAISIQRASVTGAPEHTYRGQIASDGVSVSGVYSLGAESSTWSATITGR